MELEKQVSNLETSKTEPGRPNRSEDKIFKYGIWLCSALTFLDLVFHKIGEILTYAEHLFRQLSGR